jgi:hypothetical protein
MLISVRAAAMLAVDKIVAELPRSRGHTAPAALFRQLIRSAGDSGALCGDRAPIEFGIAIKNGQVVGLKCTVEPVDAVALGHTLASGLEWTVSRATLADLAKRHAFWSVSLRNDRVRVKIYLLGASGPFSLGQVIELTHGLGFANVERLSANLHSALAVAGPDLVAVTLDNDRVTRIGTYVSKPYLRMALVWRLATALKLSPVQILGLLRWYRHAIGPVRGRLGQFGFGLEHGETARPELEAYVYRGGSEVAASPAAHARLDGSARRTLARMAGLGFFPAGIGARITGVGLTQVMIYLWPLPPR